MKTRTLHIASVSLICLALLAGFSTSGAQAPASVAPPEPHMAPLNPGFEAYLEDPPEVSYGYMPPPMDLSHLKELSIEEVEKPALPTSFDWRDQGKVTPVKNQNPCGMCWAFGTTSVLESAVLMDESTTPDFSEQSVGLCIDPSWFSMYDGADDPCMAGGNTWLASEIFIRKGAVSETCNPYDTSALQCDGSCTCDSCPAVKTVDGYRLVTDDGSQINAIKNAVYNYGPVTVAYYHNDGYEYWDPTWGAMYDCYPCSEPANHLISIIGWDDDVPHANPSHTGTGAWIVKNSWGTADSWASGAGVSDGHFYLAYDSSCASEVAYLEYKDHDPNEELLYWDEAGIVAATGYRNETAWMASVFTAPQDKVITHIDFWTTSSNAAYEIYVWDGSFGSQLAHQTGNCQEFGYYSIPLNVPISVPAGQEFTVGVRMTTPGYDFPIPVEHEIPGVVDPPIQSDVSFIRPTAGSDWTDLASYDDNACLRARMGDVENASPNAPSNPSPADGATGVSTDADLSWTGGDPDPGDTVTYDAYLEADDSTPDDLICDDVSTPTCDAGTLAYDMHYYWYVEATDNHDASTTGHTWDFTTTVGHGARTWNGSVSSDWHTADNWTPSGVPTSGDDVAIPDATNDPIVSSSGAEANSLIINTGAVLDLTDRTLTVEGTLTNNGTLKQTRGVAEGSTTNFLRITNMAGTQTKYYGVDITPSSVAGSATLTEAERFKQTTIPTARAGEDMHLLERPSKGHPKLESSLSQLLETRRSEGVDEAKAFASRHSLTLEDNRVQVVIEATGETIGDLREAVETLGGEYQTVYRALLQALVPIDALETLAERSDVQLVRAPRRPVPAAPMQVGDQTTEGVAASNASAWHAADYDGTGVRVAVIDGGFTDYASLLGTDLPASVNTADWTGVADVEVQVQDTGGLTGTDTFQVTVTETAVITSMTVSVSGNQFCSGRTTGVKRCFDIDSDATVDATVRFYFSEAERNGMTLDDLLIFHHNGDWTEEPGPYNRGGTGDAQYVEAQNVDDFSLFALDSAGGGLVYLPLVMKLYPPTPETPVLNVISNPDGDGNYTVSWNTAARADTYTLQEDDNAGFSSPTTVYGPGTATSTDISGRDTGAYYYRVKATNSWEGEQLDSGWSNTRSVDVSSQTPATTTTLFLHPNDLLKPQPYPEIALTRIETICYVPPCTSTSRWRATLASDMVGTRYWITGTFIAAADTYGHTIYFRILLAHQGSEQTLVEYHADLTRGTWSFSFPPREGPDPTAVAGDTLVFEIEQTDIREAAELEVYIGGETGGRITVPALAIGPTPNTTHTHQHTYEYTHSHAHRHTNRRMVRWTYPR